MLENETPKPVGNNEPQRLVVLPRFYKIMLGLLVVAPFSLFGGALAIFFAGLLALCALFYLIAGIVAVSRARRSGNLLSANGHSAGTIGVSVAVLVSLLLMFATVIMVFEMSFNSDTEMLREMNYDLLYYKQHHDGRFPSHDKWSDELKIAKERPWMKEGGSDSLPSCRIAMNHDALSLGKNVLDDMVVAFASSPGWNQVGGPELAKANAVGRVAVLFGDDVVRLVPARNVSSLKWRPVDRGLTPPDRIPLRLLRAAGIWALAVLIPVRILRKHLEERLLKTLLVAVVAAIMGALLGAAAYGTLYVALFKDLYIGAWAGGVSGILVALAFMTLIGHRIDRKKSLSQPFVHMAGAITGLICAVMTHSILMAVTREASFLPMVGGLGFGIYAGLFVGVIAGIGVNKSWSCAVREIFSATS